MTFVEKFPQTRSYAAFSHISNASNAASSRRYCAVYLSTSKVGRALLLSVCGEGRPVNEFEKAAGWQDLYGIERLREALDDVAEWRGLITRRLTPP